MEPITLSIGNLRVVKTLPAPYYVRIDRGHSVLANPFRMTNESDEERNRVCDEYEEYFRKKIARGTGDPVFRAEVGRLLDLAIEHNQLRLMCWCAPKRCHAETILTFLAEVLEKLGYKTFKAF